MTGTNREYKDRLFSFLFGREENKAWTLSLYNAINGTDYDDPDLITITTIREALYMGMHNDVSFLLAEMMSLYEQQSSFNPNMPLRFLQYTANIYEKYVLEHKRNKYGETLIPLPVPRLVVFYNGRREEPDEQYLYLRDAFPPPLREESDIQVRVRMVNINRGRSETLMQRCRPLYEYAWLVDRIRDTEPQAGLAQAIDSAVEDMPSDFEIRTYVLTHRREVKTMLLTEYDEALQMQLFKEEGRVEGRAEGRAEGVELLGRLMTRLLAQGRSSEAARAASDPEYREKLFAEYGLA